MYDYMLVITRKDGSTGRVGFQHLIHQLDMQDEYVQGMPLKEGGVPQVQDFISGIKRACGYVRIQALFNGNPLLEA